MPYGGGRVLWRWTDADIAKGRKIKAPLRPGPKPRSKPKWAQAMQTRELEQFAQARGWQMLEPYIDAGISGTKDSRPALNRLTADAHSAGSI
jgi:hypothetical protein